MGEAKKKARASHEQVARLQAEGKSLEAIAMATAMLEAKPRDLRAWHLLARALVATEAQEEGRLALERLAAIYGRVGDVPMAIVAALEAEEAGADPSEILDDLAQAYSAAAADLVDDWRPLPPTLPYQGEVDFDETPDMDWLLPRVRQALDAAAEQNAATETATRRYFPLLSALSPEAFSRFSRSLAVETRKEGEIIIDQGEMGEGFCIIAAGEVHVLRVSGGEEHLLARLGPGAFFGEMAIVSRAPRAARVRAAGDVVLLHADMGTVSIEMKAVPEIGRVLRAFCRARMLENVVSASQVLRRAPADDRAKILERFRESTHKKGDLLINEGEESAGLFLLISGQVMVTRLENDETLTLATLNPGDFFGEISLVLRRPAVASVKALSESVCLFLPREEFLATVNAHPELLSELYATALERDEETKSILAREAESADDLVLI